MEYAIIDGVLKAVVLLGAGAAAVFVACFFVRYLWIAFGPTPKGDCMPDIHRKNYKPFRMKSYMGME